ncbi:hypothetical protein AB0B89_11940 [Sphaerisporangium sp. NPDC049002]|uniref:hypothetical protein n=1 Tax=unclassified Sphaerisporangium TaxID=2630420 RepID=UPI0033C677D2
MFAAVALLLLMIFTVTMFEVTVNNRHRSPKPPVTETPEETAQEATDIPKP